MNAVSPGKKIVVLHTPKCGGSSLLQSLTKAFGRKAIYRDYRYIAGERITAPEVINEPLIYGHFRAVKYESLHDAYWATLIRHPLDRMLSLYFNWRFSPFEPLKNKVMIGPLRREVHEGEIGLLEFARKPKMANRLSGHYYRDFDMKRFNLIIPHENYAGGVRLLGDQIGVSLTIESANVSSSRSGAYKEARDQVMADSRMLSQLQNILKADIEFYEYCMGLPSVARAPSGARAKEA